MSSFEALVEQYAGHAQISVGKWFGKPCLKITGKAFLVQFGRDIAFKLDGEAHSEAL